MISRNIKILILLFIVATGLIVPLQKVDAAVGIAALITSFLAGLFGAVKEAITIFVKFGVATWLSCIALNWANVFLLWAADPGLISVGLKDNELVQNGWIIVRDFVNLFFILILVAIGIGTSLRLKGYEIQKILPRLLLVAVLVNFTPMIVGVIVDASNVVMDFFFSAGGIGFESTVLSSESLTDSILDKLGRAITNPHLMGNVLFESLLLMLFNFTGTFVLFTMAMLFIVRHLAIWVLVILSPLAFFCFILPRTQRIWNMWWNQLLKWSFVGIGASFFLYLAQMMIEINVLKSAPPANAMGVEVGLTSLMMHIFPLALLSISLFVINSTSAMGASSFINLAKKGSGWVKGKGKSVAMNQLRKNVRQTKEAGKKAAGPVARRLEAWAGKVSKEPVPGESASVKERLIYQAKTRAAQKAEKVATKLGSENIEELTQLLEKMNSIERALFLKTATTENEKIAAVAAKINKGETKDISTNQLDAALRRVADFSSDLAKKFAGADPRLAQEWYKEHRQQIKMLNRERMHAGPERRAEIEQEKTAIREQMKRRGLEVTKEDIRRYGKDDTLEKKILHRMKGKGIEGMSEEYLTDENAQRYIHRFWSGSQISTAARKFEQSFIDAFNKDTKKLDAITDPRDPEYLNQAQFDKLQKYFRTSPAIEFGFDKFINRRDGGGAAGDAPESGKIITPEPRGNVKFSSRERREPDTDEK